MGRRATFRTALVVGAALICGALAWSVAAQDRPPLAVRSSGGDRPSAESEAEGSDDLAQAPTTSTTTPAPDDGTTSTTVRSRRSRTETTSATGRTTSTTAGTSGSTRAPNRTATTSPPPPKELTPPPKPKATDAQFWGQVLDEAGRPIEDICVTYTPMFGLTPAVDRTDADGRYRIDVDLPYEMGMMYSLAVAPCPDHPMDVLPGGTARTTEGIPIAEAGRSYRADATMLAAPTTVDLALVDPAGRPVLGVCLRVLRTPAEEFQAHAVDDRGHVVIDRPGSRYLSVAIDGVCGQYLGYAASYSVLNADLHGGPNSARLVVPWSTGDDTSTAVVMNMQSRFDLFAVSTQSDEPNPSCVGAFSRSRWFRVTPHEKWPGATWSPRQGGAVGVTLPLGGWFATWGLEDGRLVEIGCTAAGQSLSIPAGRFDAVAVQVIPKGDVAQVGTFSS